VKHLSGGRGDSIYADLTARGLLAVSASPRRTTVHITSCISRRASPRQMSHSPLPRVACDVSFVLRFVLTVPLNRAIECQLSAQTMQVETKFSTPLPIGRLGRLLAGLRDQHWRGHWRGVGPMRPRRKLLCGKGNMSRVLRWIEKKLLDALVWLLALPLRLQAWRMRRVRKRR
jgi:hypothetical protein